MCASACCHKYKMFSIYIDIYVYKYYNINKVKNYEQFQINFNIFNF